MVHSHFLYVADLRKHCIGGLYRLSSGCCAHCVSMWLFLSLACKCSSDLRATLKPEQQHKQSVVHWDAFLHWMDERMVLFFKQLTLSMWVVVCWWATAGTWVASVDCSKGGWTNRWMRKEPGLAGFVAVWWWNNCCHWMIPMWCHEHTIQVSIGSHAVFTLLHSS